MEIRPFHAGDAQAVAAPFQCEVHRVLKSEGATRMGLGTGSRAIQAVSFYRKLGYVVHKAAYIYYLDWREYGRYRD